MKRINPPLATAVAITILGAGLTAGQAQATPTPATDPTPTLSSVVPTDTANLGRGLISLRTAKGNFLSWRQLHDDPAGTEFAVYRGSTKIGTTSVTNYTDVGAPANARYTVRPTTGAAKTLAADGEVGTMATSQDVPIQKPAGGTTPDGVAYTYTANDASVADLDADGAYEIVLKWDPTNAKDNSQAGYTGNVYLDAYELNGTRKWRIDLGRNIRAGAHYTQFQVFDYDGDNRAEVVVKTADGTRSGTGQVIGSSSADHRNSSGYILAGPEYLSVFSGTTGEVLATADYVPPRGTVSSWGDNYGNRVDRFLAGTAYLNGSRPSIIMARGYYTRSVVSAWDYSNRTLTRRWTFDSNSSSNGSAWTGQGNHQLSIADVDNDGRDEIMYGSMAIDDNGYGSVGQRSRPRRRLPRRRSGPEPRGTRGLQAFRGQVQAGRLGGRRANRPDTLASGLVQLRQRPRRGRRHLGRQRGRRSVVVGGRRVALGNQRRAGRGPQTGLDELRHLVGRRSAARAAGRHPHRQVRHRRRHPVADRQRRPVQQRHQGHPGPAGGHSRRLA